MMSFLKFILLYATNIMNKLLVCEPALRSSSTIPPRRPPSDHTSSPAFLPVAQPRINIVNADCQLGDNPCVFVHGKAKRSFNEVIVVIGS